MCHRSGGNGLLLGSLIPRLQLPCGGEVMVTVECFYTCVMLVCLYIHYVSSTIIVQHGCDHVVMI